MHDYGDWFLILEPKPVHRGRVGRCGSIVMTNRPYRISGGFRDWNLEEICLSYQVIFLILLYADIIDMIIIMIINSMLYFKYLLHIILIIHY